VFEAAGIDRAAERRKDDRWVEARLRDPATRFTPVWEHRSFFVPGADPPRAAWLTPPAAEPLLEAGAVPILLGVEGDVARFALLVVDGGAVGGGEWDDLRGRGLRMPAHEAGLLAMARGLAHWHARHAFCGACGAPTDPREAGHVRVCGGCGAQHFPRTDPAVIMRVEHEGRCLLGRQASWRPGVYSVLAGFVEPGESLEDAVAREVLEESGVPVADVRYHSSQPWPFPASLMVGFTARALSPAIRPEDEMEEVRWFTRDEVRRGLEEGSFHFPSTFSISYRLVAEWLEEGER
jgi:NAD+ diphosphatase